MKKRWLVLLLALAAVLALACAGLAEESVLSAPSISLSASSVTRGSFLNVNVGAVQGADVYRVRVTDASGEAVSGGYAYEAGAVYAQTASLAPGTYNVYGFVLDEDGNEGEHSDSLSFTVKAYTGSSNVIIRLARTQIQPGEWVLLSVYAPNKQGIRLFCEEENDLDWWSNDESWAYAISLAPGNTYHLWAEAYDANGGVYKSSTVALTVAAAPGELGDITFPMQDGSVTAGQDLAVEYAVGNAAGGIDPTKIKYCVELWDIEGGGAVYEDETLPQSGTVTISGEYLQAGRTYDLSIYTYTNVRGYGSKAETRRVLALNPTEQDLSLTVNGQSEVTVATHEHVDLTIHAPGATAIHLYKGRGGDWDYWGDQNGYQEDIHYDWEHWTQETLALYVNVCYVDYEDENAQWFLSDPLIIHVTAENGTLPPPSFTIPGTVNVGSVLDVQVDSLSESATGCWAEIHPLDENGEINRDISLAYGDISDGHIYLPTAMLQPGEKYAVHLGSNGIGWLDSASVERWFTAAGQATEGQAQFFVSKENVETREPFSAGGYVPGAKELIVYFNGNRDDQWGRWGGTNFNATNWMIGDSGDYTYTLMARYTDEDVWEDVGDPVTVHVSAPNGWYDVSQISIPAEHPAGQDLTIDLSSTGASGFDVGLWREINDNWGWGDQQDGGLSFTIPGEELTEDIYHLSINVYGRGYERTVLNAVFAVTGSSQGNVTISAPDTVICGQDFTIEVNAPGASAVSWWIPNWHEQMYQGESAQNTTQIRGPDKTVVYARACYDPIDWNSFDWNDWQHRVNWGPITAVKEITITAPNGQAGAPNVSGVPEEVVWNDTKSLHVTVGSASHAVWYDVRLRDRNDWWNERRFYHLDGPGSVDIDLSDLTPGEYCVDVYVAGEEGYAENVVLKNFTLIGNGQVGWSNHALAISGSSLPRGQMLHFSLAAADNAEWYHARIRDDDWNEYCFLDLGGPGEDFALPTANLEVGKEYFVIISFGAPGWNWNENPAETAQRFTVTDNGAARMDVGKTQALNREEVYVSIYAPGAERIRFSNYYVGKNEANWWNEDGWEGDSWQGTCRWDWPEENITLRAEAYKNGKWLLINEATVDVTALHVYDGVYLTSIVPSVVNEGEDLVIPFPEGVSSAWANVWDDTCFGSHVYWMNTNDDLYHLHDVDDPDMVDDNYWEDHYGQVTEIRVPARILKLNHAYHIDLGMYGGVGIAGGDRNGIGFTVSNGQTDSNVRITVNGSTADQSFPLCQNYTVVVTAPGACAVRAFNGHGWDYRAGSDEAFTWNDGDDGVHTLYAEACYEDRNWDGVDWNNWDWERSGLTWGGISNTITLTHYAQGQVDRPNAVLVSSTVTRGDYIEVRLIDPDPEAHYSASLWWPDENGNEFWPMGWFDQSGDTIRIPTVNLGEGDWYVRVNVGGKVSCYGNSNGGEEPTVHIVESAGNAYLNFSSYTVETDERFWNSIRVPGAVEITTTVNEPDGWQIGDWDNVWQFGPWDGESTDGDGLRFDQMGDYTVKLYARMSDNGGWEYTGISKTITATADYVYTRSDLQTMIPSVLNAGAALSVPRPEGVVWLNASVREQNGPEIYWMNWNVEGNGNYAYWDEDRECWTAQGHDGDGTLFVPAQYLKAGHTYLVHYGIGGRNVQPVDVFDVPMTVITSTTDSISLTVNGSADDQRLPVNDRFIVRVSAPGATAIRVFDGWNWHNYQADENGAVEDRYGVSGDEETRPIYAQACYKRIDWENDVDWESLNWRGVSNQIQIASYANGALPVPSFTLESSQVMRGEFIVLHLNQWEENVGYHANLYYPEGEWRWMGDAWYEHENGAIYIPTANAFEREWTVRLDAFGKVGYFGNSAEAKVYITENAAPSIRTSKSTAETWETITASVSIPGAERIRYTSNYDVENNAPNWWDENGVEGASAVFSDYEAAGVGTRTFAAEGMFGGQWSGNVITANVEITAPNGMVDEPTVHVEACQLISDGLRFAVDVPANGCAYDVEVWEYTDEFGSREWYLNTYRREWNDEFYVDGSRLIAGHTYVVFVRGLGYGYECHEVSFDVTMVENLEVPEFYLSTYNSYARGYRITGTALLNGQPMDRFILDLDSPNNRWTEYWCVYDGTFDWHDNTNGMFPWGTDEVGEWGLRIAACDENGNITSAWSEWAHFNVREWSGDNLPALALPGFLTEIDEEAFSGVNAEKIVIPEGVTSIQARAFADNGNLKVVEFQGGGEISIADSAFDNCPDMVIVAPEGSPAWQWAVNHAMGMTWY